MKILLRLNTILHILAHVSTSSPMKSHELNTNSWDVWLRWRVCRGGGGNSINWIILYEAEKGKVTVWSQYPKTCKSYLWRIFHHGQLRAQLLRVRMHWNSLGIFGFETHWGLHISEIVRFTWQNRNSCYIKLTSRRLVTRMSRLRRFISFTCGLLGA